MKMNSVVDEYGVRREKNWICKLRLCEFEKEIYSGRIRYEDGSEYWALIKECPKCRRRSVISFEEIVKQYAPSR